MPSRAVRTNWLARLAGWLSMGSTWKDDPDDDAPAGETSANLKALIARRRRNEQVRAREFEHLRQLRNRGFSGEVQVARSQLSLFDDTQVVQEREKWRMLRKIDQIEAHLARPLVAADLPDRSQLPRDDDAVATNRWSPTLLPADALALAGFVSTLMPPAIKEDPGLTMASPGPRIGQRTVPVFMAPGKDTVDGALSDPATERAAMRLALAGTGSAECARFAPQTADVPVLAGALCGDIDARLRVLSAAWEPEASLVVSCAQVTQVDFAAAGCLLDWAQAMQARGCRVQLQDVHPLVATFLHSVGLTEHAQVARRSA